MQHEKERIMILLVCFVIAQYKIMKWYKLQYKKRKRAEKKVYQKKRKPMCRIKIDLKALLKQKRYTYQQLAECTGVSISTISRICHKSNTCPTIAQKVATALGYDVEDLFLYL